MSASVEIDLAPLLEESVLRRYEVDAELCDIHGEHKSRTQIIHQRVFDVTEESSIGEVSEEVKLKTEKASRKRSRPENVHTFPINESGEYLIPLGGAHGYIMGALKASIPDLYKDRLKTPSWEGYGIRGAMEVGHAIIIKPEWVSVGKTLAHSIEEPRTHMTKLSGPSGGMMAIYYDVVARAAVHFTIDITNNKVPESVFLPLLAHVQLLGLGPKGRGQLKITKVIRTRG